MPTPGKVRRLIQEKSFTTPSISMLKGLHDCRKIIQGAVRPLGTEIYQLALLTLSPAKQLTGTLPEIL